MVYDSHQPRNVLDVQVAELDVAGRLCLQLPSVRSATCGRKRARYKRSTTLLLPRIHIEKFRKKIDHRCMWMNTFHRPSALSSFLIQLWAVDDAFARISFLLRNCSVSEGNVQIRVLLGAFARRCGAGG